ncbi:MAG TPA: hypothetical protein VEY05_10280 [Beijerinckiaceae bacterium]|jgi:hypothetical protein|nr:hypothetical protein [Beijerinckiaceae bacterium]
MPRFYFHFHNGLSEESDREGVVLANRALAQTEGRRAVTMLVEEDEGAFDWSRWLLTVLHEDGSCVLELPFQSVIDDLRPSHH